MKGLFPYLFTDIKYIGELPDFKYWTGLNFYEYQFIYSNYLQYSDGLWSFKEQAITYCKTDCMALFEIISKFNELVYNQFGINVHSSLP